MKVTMSDEIMTISLSASIFSGKEEEWPELIVKFQAYLATKGYTEAVQTNFKSKLPATEDQKLDVSINIGKKE